MREAETGRILGIFKPNGQWIGKTGSGSRVKELPGGLKEAERYLDILTHGGTLPYREMEDNKGRIYELPAGAGYVTYRKTSNSGPPTIEINFGKKAMKFKFL